MTSKQEVIDFVSRSPGTQVIRVLGWTFTVPVVRTRARFFARPHRVHKNEGARHESSPPFERDTKQVEISLSFIEPTSSGG